MKLPLPAPGRGDGQGHAGSNRCFLSTFRSVHLEVYWRFHSSQFVRLIEVMIVWPFSVHWLTYTCIGWIEWTIMLRSKHFFQVSFFWSISFFPLWFPILFCLSGLKNHTLYEEKNVINPNSVPKKGVGEGTLTWFAVSFEKKGEWNMIALSRKSRLLLCLSPSGGGRGTEEERGMNRWGAARGRRGLKDSL